MSLRERGCVSLRVCMWCVCVANARRSDGADRGDVRRVSRVLAAGERRTRWGCDSILTRHLVTVVTVGTAFGGYKSRTEVRAAINSTEAQNDGL